MEEDNATMNTKLKEPNKGNKENNWEVIKTFTQSLIPFLDPPDDLTEIIKKVFGQYGKQGFVDLYL